MSYYFYVIGCLNIIMSTHNKRLYQLIKNDDSHITSVRTQTLRFKLMAVDDHCPLSEFLALRFDAANGESSQPT